MFKKGSKLLAVALAAGLTITTFGSDFYCAKVWAADEETAEVQVEESAPEAETSSEEESSDDSYVSEDQNSEESYEVEENTSEETGYEEYTEEVEYSEEVV